MFLLYNYLYSINIFAEIYLMAFMVEFYTFDALIYFVATRREFILKLNSVTNANSLSFFMCESKAQHKNYFFLG